MTTTYQIRKFIKGKTERWDVYSCREIRHWFRKRERKTFLATFPTILAAEEFVSEHAGGYYDKTYYYCQDGSPMRGGWA